jgi:hypothetical protein
MPSEMQWPRFDGNECHFIGQIDCSELPKNLWAGVGPRTGWLLFFYGEGASGWAIKVFHSSEFGTFRHPETNWSPNVVRLSPAKQKHWFEPPHWPVEIITGDEENRWKWEQAVEHERKFDPANPLHLPYDRASLDVLLELSKTYLRRLQSKARKRITKLAEATERPIPESGVARVIFGEAMEMLHRAERIDTALPYSKELWIPYEASFHRMSGMIDDVLFPVIPQPMSYNELKAAVHVAVAKASQLLYGCMDVPKKHDDTLAQAKQEIENVEILLTKVAEVLCLNSRKFDHDYCVSLVRELGEKNVLGPILNDFVLLSTRLAAGNYVRAGKLLFPGYERFIERWACQAQAEKNYMGGRADRSSTSVWTNSTDVILFELGSSDMFGWLWGDLQKVIVTISLLDLQAMNFAVARAELSG